MGFYHHGTIRRYTAAMLSIFNGIEVQYKDSTGALHSKNVPLKYGFREKSSILDEYTTKQLISGNTNVLPRATLAISTFTKTDERVRNKNVKIATKANDDTFEYMYNSVPYTINYELEIQCRGMNEATMIIEQVAPKFNPTYEVDIWDADNLSEPTRIPVKLLDVSLQSEEYEEISTNIVTVNFGLEIKGNLYPPIKTVERIKDFKMFINESDGDFYSRKTILGWDVNDEGELVNETYTSAEDTKQAPVIISIQGDNVVIGDNDIYAIFTDNDNKYEELTFTWEILSGDATVSGTTENAVLTVNSVGGVEVQITITDVYGNYNSLSTIFTV